MTPKQFFAQHPVFTAAEYATAMCDRAPASHDSILAYHQRAGHLHRLRRGLYITVPAGTKSGYTAVDPFLLATKLAADSVLAYHAALSFHCNVRPAHRHFHYFTATAPRDFRFGGNVFRPVHFPNALRVRGLSLWGVQNAERSGIALRVTSVERTLVDVLDRLDLGAGLEESWHSVEFFQIVDVDRAVEYALLLRSATTAAKVGFFFSQHRDRLMVKDSHLATLREHLPRSPHYIRPRRITGDGASKFVRDWNIIVPKTLCPLLGTSGSRRQSP